MVAAAFKSFGKKFLQRQKSRPTQSEVLPNVVATPIQTGPDITSLEAPNVIASTPEVNAPEPTPSQSGSGITTEKVWRFLKIGSFIILTLLLIIALMPIIPFWVITYHSFWGEFGFLRFIVTKYRNF